MSVVRADKLKGKRYRCFLDGREIHWTFYTDRRRGVLRTFDVFDDNSGPRPVGHLRAGESADPSWKGKPGEVYWKELRGRVTVERIK